MKKLYLYADYMIAAAGIAGCALRYWLLSAGTDKNGLYPAAHPGWTLYLLLTAGVFVLLALLTRQAGQSPVWQPNFPRRALPALGHALAGCSIALFSILQLGSGGPLTIVTCLAGFFAAASLLLLGWQRFSGQTPVSMAYLPPCPFFALQLFCMGTEFRAEPELLRFLPQLLAIAASTLAAYQLWGFGVGLGSRKKSLFWSLSAAYLCLSAIPSHPMLYLSLGLWHLWGHCTLRLPPEEPENDLTETEETQLSS